MQSTSSPRRSRRKQNTKQKGREGDGPHSEKTLDNHGGSGSSGEGLIISGVFRIFVCALNVQAMVKDRSGVRLLEEPAEM